MTTQTKRPRRQTHTTPTLPERRRWSIDEYERMIAAGILDEDEHLELIEGAILCMAPIGTGHASCVRLLARWFMKHLPDLADVSVQCPIRLPPDSEPEPDIAIIRWREDSYATRHPEPDDIFLLIEVADTSLAFDRRRKVPRYAAAGIREVWLADLTTNRLLVHRKPAGRRYAEVRTLGRDGSVAPLAFPDLVLSLAEIFR